MDLREFEGVNGIYSISESKEMSIRKGTWSFEEDSILIDYIAIHGEGRWNYLARNAGLKRTGRSCRMRWKNYLRPNLRRGSFTPQEQLRIMELHCCYGNRWSRIAEFLPGRTDNEIKNYWRTRVHKQAKLLKFDVNSTEFRDFIRNIWLPVLSQQIQASDKSHDHMLDITSEYGLETSTGPQTLQVDYWDHEASVMNKHYGPDFFQGIDSPMEPTWHCL